MNKNNKPYTLDFTLEGDYAEITDNIESIAKRLKLAPRGADGEILNPFPVNVLCLDERQDRPRQYAETIDVRELHAALVTPRGTSHNRGIGKVISDTRALRFSLKIAKEKEQTERIIRLENRIATAVLELITGTYRTASKPRTRKPLSNRTDKKHFLSIGENKTAVGGDPLVHLTYPRMKQDIADDLMRDSEWG